MDKQFYYCFIILSSTQVHITKLLHLSGVSTNSVHLTFRGILKSISGKEIMPNIFPVLRTTTVASICEAVESGTSSIR